MTREEAIECNKNLKMYMKLADKNQPCKFLEENYIALDMAINSLEIDERYELEYEQIEPCDDAISRQAVEDAIAETIVNGESLGYAIAQEIVSDLPPVNPQEPKTGHWEWVQYDYNPKLGNWHCSECRCVVVECVDKNEKGGIPLYKYCPQCGAKMAESEDKE